MKQNQSTIDYSHPMHYNWSFYLAEGKKYSDWTEYLYKISPETSNIGKATEKESLLFSRKAVSDSATPWTTQRQASLSCTISQSLLKLMSIASKVPSNHLIFCHHLLLPPSIFPSIRVNTHLDKKKSQKNSNREEVLSTWSRASTLKTIANIILILHNEMLNDILLRSRRGFPSGSAVKNPPAMQKMQERQVRSLGQEDPLEECMATHSSILAWRIPWTEEPSRLQSVGLLRVRHNWNDWARTQDQEQA